MAALALAFATSTAIFNTTYDGQARVDAELTNGSDVTVSGTTANPAGPHLGALASCRASRRRSDDAPLRLCRAPTCRTSTASIRGRSASATHLSNAYFSGGTPGRSSPAEVHA